MALISEDVTYDDFINALKNYADNTYAKIDKY